MPCQYATSKVHQRWLECLLIQYKSSNSNHSTGAGKRVIISNRDDKSIETNAVPRQTESLTLVINNIIDQKNS